MGRGYRLPKGLLPGFLRCSSLSSELQEVREGSPGTGERGLERGISRSWRQGRGPGEGGVQGSNPAELAVSSWAHPGFSGVDLTTAHVPDRTLWGTGLDSPEKALKPKLTLET